MTDYSDYSEEEILEFITGLQEKIRTTKTPGWDSLEQELQERLASHMSVLQNSSSTLDQIRVAQGASQEISTLLFLKPSLLEQMKSAQDELDSRRRDG